MASVNRVIDHVVQNLERSLTLETLAQVAHFSPYHFHRIFKALMGETPNDFVGRLRVERALAMMTGGGAKSLTEIALSSGFGSLSDFSRSFKRRHGVAPSAFDVKSLSARRRREIQLVIDESAGRRLTHLPPPDDSLGFKVRLHDLPARTVAYLRVLRPFRPGVVQRTANRLLSWAIDRGVAEGQWLGYMWDNPQIVALDDCRYDVAVEVTREIPDPEIGCFRFPPMLVAEIEIRGSLDLEQRAIDWLYGSWLPQSGYLPDDQPCFEAWMGHPFQHGSSHFELYLQLPVKRPFPAMKRIQ